MKGKYLSVTLFVFVASLFLLRLNHIKIAYSITDHVVISEIQTSGSGDTDDEFVELYNPTNNAVNLNNWKLTKKTQLGTESDLVTSFSGSIPAHGYFLIAHNDYDGTPVEDITYNVTILADNNTVLLYDELSSLVDKVGLGTATDKEIAATTNPTDDHSRERKATSSSTSVTMSGTEATAGNGEDTDNNSSDFVGRTASDPQNSASVVEPDLITPTITPSITPSETPTPTLTPTETPTPTPTETLTPTLTPTDTPTEILTPTQTLTPTETPEETLTPTPTISETITPSPFFRSRLFECHIEYLDLDRFGFTFRFPRFQCVRI